MKQRRPSIAQHLTSTSLELSFETLEKRVLIDECISAQTQIIDPYSIEVASVIDGRGSHTLAVGL